MRYSILPQLIGAIAGCSSQAIALRLDISRHTVKDHRKAIFRKLRIGSLAELFALRGRVC